MTLEQFDPVLANYLRTIKGQDFRKLFHTAIDGTATKRTSSPVDPPLVDKFLNSCLAWRVKGGEVNWICMRGVARGPGNLFVLRGDHIYIGLTGCDGNEKVVGGLEEVQKFADFSENLRPLDELCLRYNSDPISIVTFGASVLAVLIKQDNSGYGHFKNAMDGIIETEKSFTGVAFRRTCNRSGIFLQREDTIGILETIRKIRETKKQEIGIEIYAGNNDSHIEAQRAVRSERYGFAYKVCSSRDELMADAARGPDALDYVSCLIDGPEQFARLIEMIATEL